MKENLGERKKIIKTRGIYYLYDKDEIVYVGQSIFCERRIFAHIRNKKFDSYSIIEVKDNKSLDEKETREILKYEPKYNKILSDNKNFTTLRKYFKEKYNKRICGIKKRTKKLEEKGVFPIIYNNLRYYKKKELEKVI